MAKPNGGILFGAARLLDRGVAWLSRPHAATPAYDAAGSGSRLKGWNASHAGVNTLLLGSGATLRARSRDMVRKNAYAGNALDKYVSNVIGTGIKPRAMHPDETRREEIMEAWRRWVDEADAAGCTNFYGLQAMAVRSMMEGGDCFARLRARRPSDGLSVPLQIELLESEMVPLEKTQSLTGHNTLRGGVEFDGLGRRVAYHFHRQHPGDVLFGGRGLGQLSRVPAADVVHLFKPLRPGQVRGEPWLANVLLRLYELDQYEDAELVRQKLASMITGFITQGTDADANPILPKNEDDEDEPEVYVSKLEPGTFNILGDGENIEFAGAPERAAGQQDFIKGQLRAIAAGGKVSYEQLTGDLENVNFSSIRAGLLEIRRQFEQDQRLFITPQMNRPIWRRFITDSVLAGRFDASDFQRNPNAYLDVRWVPQGFRWVDPQKDVEAYIRAIRSGLMSRTEAAQLGGFDAEEIDRMIAEENERADRLGLSYDSDGRRARNAGEAASAKSDPNAESIADPDEEIPTDEQEDERPAKTGNARVG